MNKIKRIPWIDTARGLAMLLVVLGHSIGYIDNPLNKFILSFHMPLFFFVAGLCAKASPKTLWTFFTYKMRRYGFAQLLLAVICMGCDFFTTGSLHPLKNLFIWFLPVLLYTELLFQVVARIQKHLLFVGLALGTTILLSVFPIHTVVHVEIVPMAFLFYEMGFGFMQKVYRNRIQIMRSCILGGGGKPLYRSAVNILLMALLGVSALNNASVLMYENYYGNLVLFFLSAIIGIYLLCRIGKFFEQNQVLHWYGMNSMYVYVLHFKMTPVFHFLGAHLLGIRMDLYHFPYYFFIFALEIGLIYIMIEMKKFLEKKIGFC